ncbi:Appr-1-p processing enzyme family protein [Trichomonas vaginalis G3]|uniref:Appr-1-p processing enzyme family protein n=1 Tax=Trichomonas vaginalis (strain ATCC PRA-98 / G3) TaxID=412133 RepID=A2DE53_TRIV3|nr:ADP-D-ribose binding [Trichomonas vaginalis G3]EAY21271.1 Appr-1-p processing enzyme family protein [Trichomonas vaginalis G3]KAI5548845.1 ADP-D-ribose binding [Trichomonas vaginalis G3]|eukprot:XP_001582257.1 Appr-1-p processing enzyme family protein [Trichomonas vaginalis G3]
MSNSIVDLASVPKWSDAGPQWMEEMPLPRRLHANIRPCPEINNLISIWKCGDSTRLKCDAVINRTDNNFSSGGALFTSINNAAGPQLAQACRQIGHCDDCNTVVTPGFSLPAKYVIHTVGPTGDDDPELESTMDSVFSHIDGESIRSIGMAPFFIENNGFSLGHATQIAFSKTRKFLENPENRQKVDRIVFIVTQPHSIPIFVRLLYLYFPIEEIEVDSEVDGDIILEEEDEEYYSDYDADEDNIMFEFNQGESEPELCAVIPPGSQISL